MLLVQFLLLVGFAKEFGAWRTFFRGRSVGGNLGLPPRSRPIQSNAVAEQWFVQNLDHFDPNNDATWKQRYFVNAQFYDEASHAPVFLMIGGEGEASEEWMTQGTWIDYAERFKALCFQLEHRYYGKSHPTKDLSTKNLVYLTSQQALADLATFIAAMNEQYKLPADTKWIAFGGSYPGSLAAWLRLKYPHLVHGAMSASGPLLAEIDFSDFFKVVVEALRTNGNDCVTAIKQGTAQVDVLLKHKVGQRNLNKLFNLCDSIEDAIDNQNDISNFFASLADNFAGIVQYNKDNRIGKSAKGKNITIDTLCDIMNNQNLGPPITRLARVNDLLLKTNDEKCLDYKYDKMIQTLANSSWSSEVAEGGRQWTYQTCTEFGFYQTSDYRPQIFGDKFPVDFYVQQCIDIFGPKYNEKFLTKAVDRTNTLYGALDIEVTNVVFVHGSIDPWHALGITKTINQGAPAIYIKGTAHCANMYPKSKDDLPQLNEAREQIAQLIDTWIRL